MSRHRKSSGFLSRPRSTVGMAEDGDEFYDDSVPDIDLADADADADSVSVDQPRPAPLPLSASLPVPLPAVAPDDASESSAPQPAAAPSAGRGSEPEAEVEAVSATSAVESPAVTSTPALTSVGQPRSTSPYISMGYAPRPQQSVDYPPVSAPVTTTRAATAPAVPAPEPTVSQALEPIAAPEPAPFSEPITAPEPETIAPDETIAPEPEAIAPDDAIAPPQLPAVPEPASPPLPAPTLAFVPPSIEPASALPAPAPVSPAEDFGYESAAADGQVAAKAAAVAPPPMAYQPPAPLIAAAAAAVADYTVMGDEADGSAVPPVAHEMGLAAALAVDLVTPHPQPRPYEPAHSAAAPVDTAPPGTPATAPITTAPITTAPPAMPEDVASDADLLAPVPYTPAIAPDRRTRRSQERGSQRRRRGLIIGGGIVVAALVAAVGVRLATQTPSKGPVAGDGAVALHQTTALMMLVGSKGDMIAGALISADPASGVSHVVLVPSKVIVSIPGHGSQQLARATEFDRATVPMAAVSDLFGVRVDGSWVVDAAALATLIDRTGGITVDSVDTDVHGLSGGRDVVLVPAGSHVLLNGSQAVAYASYLAAQEDEIIRLVRFQQVLDALVNTLPDSATDVTDRLSALGAGTVFGGAKAAVGAALTAFHKSSVAGTVNEEPMPVRSIDSGGDEPIYGVDSDKMRDLVSRDFAGATLKRRAGGLDRVLVENGVGTPGLGECVRNQLVAAGFDFKGSSNLPGFTFRDKPSLVLIYDSQPANIEAGQAVATALKLPVTAVQVSSEPQNLADVVIVLGKDYACS